MKKRILLFAAAIMALLSVNAQTILKGDMNGDNLVDVSDVTSVVDCILTGNVQTLDVSVSPYKVDNAAIVGTWSKSADESITFSEDGTTDYAGAATYKYYPFQGFVNFYNAQGMLSGGLFVFEVTPDYLILASTGYADASYWLNGSAQRVESITLSAISLTLEPGKTSTLIATVTPEDAVIASVVWSSSDESVATVSADGVVTAVGGGTCVITCMAAAGTSVSATCTVTVPKYVQSITLSETYLLMEPDKIVLLLTTILPANAENQSLTWSSSDPDVAKVSSSGKVIAIAPGTCTITATASDGSGVTATCSVKVANQIYKDHEYVNLGLPSGTLWATTNVGADEPYEYGDYFAWGETEGYESGKTMFDWDSYKWYEDSQYMTKYCTDYYYGKDGFTDGLSTLEAADDAATANWGGIWRMPTYEEWQELHNTDYCTWAWCDEGNTEFNGVAGCKVSSNVPGFEDSYIFLPAAGCHYISTLFKAGSNCFYWSSSLYTLPQIAWECCYSKDRNEIFFDERYVGNSVRPVVRPGK